MNVFINRLMVQNLWCKEGGESPLDAFKEIYQYYIQAINEHGNEQ